MSTIIIILVIVMASAFIIGWFLRNRRFLASAECKHCVICPLRSAQRKRSISWHCLLLHMNSHGMPLKLTCLNDRLYWIKFYKRCKSHDDRKQMQRLRKTCNWSIMVTCCMFVVVFVLNGF